MKRLDTALFAFLALGGCATVRPGAPEPVQVWVTSADQIEKLAPKPDAIAEGTSTGTEEVTIDSSRRFQRMYGFGAAMTDASAEVLSSLPPDKRHALMEELFSRANGGLGLSFTRLTVGASDFSRTHYSYDDTPANAADPDLRYFSIAPATAFVLPRMREALAINPALKVMISPWSPPAWMKTSRSLIQGKLEPRYYSAFANYLARTVRAFDSQGVPVSMVTIQNEPDFEPDSYPGMRVSAAERAAIIGGYVGPAFKALGLKTQILDWDHNWNEPEQPLAVLADPAARRFISGVAWHCYEGDVPAQTPVHDAYPDKDAWVTECSGGDWSPSYAETLGWMTDKLIIGAANNWARGTLLWNIALNPQHGPHDGGCSDCRGVVTIDPATGEITRNVEYYVLGHASRFILPGAYRIAETSRDGAVEAAAFLNPDGSKVVIVHRLSGTTPLEIGVDGQRYSVALPIGSVATLRWSAGSR